MTKKFRDASGAKYVVNRFSEDGFTKFNITRYSEDGYRGRIRGIFVGTHTECATYIDSLLHFKIVEDRGYGITSAIQYFVSRAEAERYLKRYCIPYQLNPSLWVSQAYYEEDEDKNGDGKPFLYRIDSN